jgi:hypothetical protein
MCRSSQAVHEAIVSPTQTLHEIMLTEISSLNRKGIRLLSISGDSSSELQTELPGHSDNEGREVDSDLERPPPPNETKEQRDVRLLLKIKHQMAEIREQNRRKRAEKEAALAAQQEEMALSKVSHTKAERNKYKRRNKLPMPPEKRREKDKRRRRNRKNREAAEAQNAAG